MARTTKSTTAKSTAKAASTAPAKSMPRRNAAKPAPAAQPVRPKTTNVFNSIGAIFDGKQEGEFRVILDHAFLEMIGLETDDASSYTLVVLNKVSDKGNAYRSAFLATETPVEEDEEEEIEEEETDEEIEEDEEEEEDEDETEG